MRRAGFMDAQIIGMIQRTEAGMPTASCAANGLSQGTFYQFKPKYVAAWKVSDAAKAESAGCKNASSNGCWAIRLLDNVVLKDLVGKELTTPMKREGSAHSDAGP